MILAAATPIVNGHDEQPGGDGPGSIGFALHAHNGSPVLGRLSEALEDRLEEVRSGLRAEACRAADGRRSRRRVRVRGRDFQVVERRRRRVRETPRRRALRTSAATNGVGLR